MSHKNKRSKIVGVDSERPVALLPTRYLHGRRTLDKILSLHITMRDASETSRNHLIGPAFGCGCLRSWGSLRRS